MERYNPDIQIGLNQEQVNERINSNLVNYIDQPPTKTIGQILRSNFFTYFNFLNTVLGLLILFAGVLSGNIIESLKNCLFVGVIIANSVISTIQEVISKKIIDKLSLISAAKTNVIRDGKEEQISVESIVLDDIVKFKTGNQIVTDSIIMDGSVEVDESFITGESDTILKNPGDMLLSGSFISSGNCIAKVEHIGKDNYISKISKEAKIAKKDNSIIMDSFAKIVKVMSIVIVPTGILLFASQMNITNSVSESIMNTVAALIGMIPEGLLLLTSSVMAVSVIRLSKYHVLVQKLYCIETLARVDTVCLDKTGTITEGTMEVVDVVNYTDESLNNILSNIAASFEDKNNTMQAIANKFQLVEKYEVENKIEFSSKRKFSAVSFKNLGAYYIGAPEFLLKEKIENIEKYQEYRTLVIIKAKKLEEQPKDYQVLGLVLIQDKVKSDAKDTLEYFRKQGVDLKIISGDNYRTVATIASRAGFVDVTAIDATEINDENIDSIVKKYNIFGRVTPEQKKKIIQSLQKQGHVVAMTGDGVNDVLALKQSDCSIAMASGADAAKNISQIVLLDSNFSALPHIVAEGRRTINNIQKSASLLLIKTFFTALLVIACLILQSEFFYVPIQLTLITTCTISIPSFILALEPNNERIKGDFMINVIGKSLPASLTVVFNVLMIYLYQKYFNLSSDITSTLIVMMTATTGFIYLIRLCRPFNLLRIGLLVTLISLFLFALIFQFSFFDLSELQTGTIILYIVFTFASVYVFDKLNLLINLILVKYDREYRGAGITEIA